MKTRFTSLVEGQDQLARGIESLPDSEARDAYRALLIVVHQLRRVKLGQGKPSALDDPDTLADSFEDYFNEMDMLSDEELGADYETVKGVVSSTPDAKVGATAFLVVILGEIIRREGVAMRIDGMAGFDRVHQMVNRLQRSVGGFE
jgi:hypothetical protein